MNQRKRLVFFAEASRYLDREALMKVGASLFVGDIKLPDEIPQQVEDGGAGSGNWGHKGRPGIHGGSAKGSGGKAMRKDIQVKYEGAKKTQNFRAAYKKALPHKYSEQNRDAWHSSLSDDERIAVKDQYENVKKQANSKETYEHYIDRLFRMMTAEYTPSVTPNPAQPSIPPIKPQQPTVPQEPTNQQNPEVPQSEQPKSSIQEEAKKKQGALLYSMVEANSEKIKNEILEKMLPTDRIVVSYTNSGKEYTMQIKKQGNDYAWNINGIESKENAGFTATVLSVIEKSGTYGVQSCKYEVGIPQDKPMGSYYAPQNEPQPASQIQPQPIPQPVPQPIPQPVPQQEEQEPAQQQEQAQQPTPQPAPQKPVHAIKHGDNITNTYKPDPNAKSKINDIIHQQGFDGIPRVVDDDEFDEIVKNGQMPLMLRTYSGVSQEQADDFDKMLQSGDWYVQCATGGAYEGQGMYTVASYNSGSSYEQHELKMQMGRYQRYSRQKAMVDAQVPNGLHKIKDTHTGQITMIEETPTTFGKNPPKDGEIVYIKGYSSSTQHKGANGYVSLDASYRGYFYSKGKLYAINDQDIEYDPQHEYYSSGPKITKNTTYYRQADKKEWGLPQRVPVIRAMTLDPSAKILTSDNAELLCIKYNNSLEEKKYERLSLGMQNGMIKFDASKAFPSTDTTIKAFANGKFDSQLVEIYGNNDAKFRKDFQAYVCASLYSDCAAQNPHMAGAGNPFSIKGMPMHTRNLFKKIKDAGYFPNAQWMQKAIDKLSPTPQPITDHGQIAAMYGYDAISAKDTGSSVAGGNYLIVVNRTKVILKKSRVIKKQMYKP